MGRHVGQKVGGGVVRCRVLTKGGRYPAVERRGARVVARL
jgi:hypothetical protein